MTVSKSTESLGSRNKDEVLEEVFAAKIITLLSGMLTPISIRPILGN